ncbi:hypothetical protein ACHAXT_010125 [Thalassiosira profunda]
MAAAALASIPRRLVARAASSLPCLARPSTASARIWPKKRRATPPINHRPISTTDDDSNSVQVPPPPSWSVSDLRLTSADDEKISEEELATLARRCLIDVRRLSPERRERLRSHVAGIVRCASVLLDARNLEAGEQLTDEEIYDAPRGLGKLPIRRDDDLEGDDDWAHDAGEANAVMQSESVKSKMVTSEDGESFFSVVTTR